MLIEDFKTHIKNFIDVNNYVEKSKKGAIEFIGFKFKDLLVNNETENIKEEKKIEVELNIPNVVEKKKKVIKKSSEKILIDDEIDKQIAEQYKNTEEDILDIALLKIIEFIRK